MKAVALLWAAALGAQTREIPFDGVNILRADRKADLVAGDHRVELRRGTVVFRIADSGLPPVEIATPCVTVHPYLLGEYRVEVKRSGESIITPLGGDVKVSAPQGVEWVAVGSRMIARGPADASEFRIVSALTGWRWIAAKLAALTQGGGGASAGAETAMGSGDSAPAARPHFPPSAPASSVGRGASSGETRPGSHATHGK